LDIYCIKLHSMVEWYSLVCNCNWFIVFISLKMAISVAAICWSVSC